MSDEEKTPQTLEIPKKRPGGLHILKNESGGKTKASFDGFQKLNPGSPPAPPVVPDEPKK